MFIAGRLQVNVETTTVTGWEIIGFYSTEEKAKKRCIGKFDYVAGPFTLDEDLPDEIFTPEIQYFPNLGSDYKVVELTPNKGKSFKVDIVAVAEHTSVYIAENANMSRVALEKEEHF